MPIAPLNVDRLRSPFRRVSGPLLFLILALPAHSLLGQTAPASKPNEDPTVEERVFIASKIYSSLQIYFAHFQGVPDLKLDQAYRSFLKEALAAKDRKEFDLACMAFVASMKNGHTEFWDPWFLEKYGRSLGWKIEYIENKWVAVSSTNPDLKVGEVIAKINDKPAEAVFQENKKYIAASSERSARTQFFSKAYLLPDPLNITLESGKTIAIDRPTSRFKFALPMATEGQWLKENRVAYIKVPSFNNPRFQTRAVQLVEEYKAAKALIVDVRGNGGGNTPGALIQSLMDRPYRTSSFATPESVGLQMIRMGASTMKITPSQTVAPKPNPYKGLVFLLIDEHTASAAEDFSMPFKDNSRATLMGETTWGSTGQPFVCKLDNGSMFRISSKRELFPDGKPFEGVGIAPDIVIPRKIADIQKGVDRVLREATALAEEKTK